MKTADLIAALAADTPKVRPAPIVRPMLAACTVGAVATFLVLVVWLGMQPLDRAILTRAFWMKASYTIVLAVAGLLLVSRLARPGGKLGWVPLIAFLAIALMLGLSGLEMSRTPPGDMPALWMGRTWAVCSMRILVLSIPVYAGAIWALRRLAPTRLALAGAAAGLLAGSVGATIYGLYCAESAATFVVTWYTLGILASAAIGAVVGSRLLRW